MGFALLWVESLAAALLLIAAATAHRAQATRVWPARALLAAVVTVALVVGAGETLVSAVLVSARIEQTWLAYTVSWLVCLLAGGVWLLWRGLRSRDGACPAAVWPRTRLALGGIAALLLHLITLWNLDTSMRLQLASVRMEAGAIALGVAPPRLPDKENAALAYEQAFAMLKRADEQKKGAKELQTTLGRWQRDFEKRDYPAGDADLREYLQQCQGAVETLKRAAAMPGLFFERDYPHMGLDTPLPELAQMRNCARLLAMDARCRAAEGNLRAALEDVAAIRGMAAHISSEPILISGLVSVAIEATGAAALEGVLTTGSPTEEDLARVPVAEHPSYRRVFLRCLTGEEAFGLSAFATVSDRPFALAAMVGETPSTTENLCGSELAVLWRLYLLPADMEGYRKIMKRMRESATADFANIQAQTKELESDIEQRRSGILSAMVVPAVARSQGAFARGETTRRLSDLALAVARYRAKTGKYPERAELLVPAYISEIPADPFDNKPLRFIASEKGVTLYSIGQNLTDENGNVRDNENGDIVFCVGDVASPPAN